MCVLLLNIYINMEGRDHCQVSSMFFHAYFLRRILSQNMDLTDLVRLVDHEPLNVSFPSHRTGVRDIHYD